MEPIPAGASESPTPILDRLAPLPPPARQTLTPAQTLLGVGIIAIELTVWLYPPLRRTIAVPFFQWLDIPWTGPRLLSLVLLVLAASVAALALHEAGHVVGGLSAGFRFLSVRVGPLLLERPLRISWYRGPGALSRGVAVMSAARRDHLRLRAAVFVLAGPAASLLSCGVALLPVRGLFSNLFLLASALTFAGVMVPQRTPLGSSDGARLWLLWRDRAPCRRWLALLKLQAEIQEGVLTEARQAEYLAEAVAVRDPSPETVLAHVFAYSAAVAKGQDQEAGEHLETCLRYLSYAPARREGVISDAAVFLARRRKRPDLAAQWLDDLKGTSNPRLLVRVEAAVLEAQGDVVGALRKLDEYEALLLALPQGSPQREMLLQGVPGWRAELKAADDHTAA